MKRGRGKGRIVAAGARLRASPQALALLERVGMREKANPSPGQIFGHALMEVMRPFVREAEV